MHDPRLIKTFKEETTIYPNVKAVRIDVLDNSNRVYEATVTKEEAELLKYLKFVVFPELKERQQTKLLEHIGNFGFIRYEAGSFDESYEG